ncbi:MAG: diguanylate cyclase [Desulfovibrionaceae bacterium]|nr:diguanylate cyclase [Desulfovibrionaceae bacterium]
MRLSIFHSMALVVVIILLTALSTFFVFYHFLYEGFEHHVQEDLETMRLVVNNNLKNLKDRLYQEVIMLSTSVELADAFRSNDYEKMVQVAKTAKEHFRASFATITDTNGTVLARGYLDKRGDNIAFSNVLLKALKGTPNVDITKLRNNGLSVAAAAPVYVDGKFVGALLFGYSFKNHDFVDEIKESTKLEMTVFDRDVRLSTTIIRDGTRAIGTVLESNKVRSDVLKNGMEFSANTTILGKSYKTVYWPIQNSQGLILGMWFIGTEMESIQVNVTGIAISCLVATIIIAISLAVLGALIFRETVNPLAHKAYEDMLTGILNRAGFERALNAALANKNCTGALFLFDLDFFKEINDTLGHPTGDECLKRVAYLLKEVFGDDIVARLGGDEFIVFSPSLNNIEAIKEKAKQFNDIITYTYKLVSGESLTVTASIGIAICPEHGKTYTPLYNNADSALYMAKSNGRNQFIIFSHDLICSHAPLPRKRERD